MKTLTPKEQLALAISITAKVFESVLDKSGEPYILHCSEVRRNVMKWEDTELEVAAILHDIVEDTDWTLDMLRNQGFSERVIKIVDGLTRRFDSGETYEEFISRILNDADCIKCKMGHSKLSSNTIKISGVIMIDPKDVTKKHKGQSSWKKMGLIMFSGEICEYYAWFLEKRFNIVLNQPLRGPHISFINDSVGDIAKGLGITEKEAHEEWEIFKNIYHNQTIDVILTVSPRSDGKHWWLNILEEDRGVIHDIRMKLGLPRPYFGLHLSLGFANEKNIEHSEYILRLIEKGLVNC